MCQTVRVYRVYWVLNMVAWNKKKLFCVSVKNQFSWNQLKFLYSMDPSNNMYCWCSLEICNASIMFSLKLRFEWYLLANCIARSSSSWQEWNQPRLASLYFFSKHYVKIQYDFHLDGSNYFKQPIRYRKSSSYFCCPFG